MRLRLLPTTSIAWTLWQRLRGRVAWRTYYWNEDEWEPMPDKDAGYCMARFEAGRTYPCVKPIGHDGPHEHPMDPVPEDAA